MSDRIIRVRKFLEAQKGKQEFVEKRIQETKIRIKEKSRDSRRYEEVQEIIREVGLETQKQLQYHISEIASLALDAIFPNPYELVVEFVQRRNKTECDLYFQRDGNRMNPLSAAGGGVVDVASFALRVASWSMQRPRYRDTIVLDEPFRYLSTDLLSKAGEMLKEISNKLGLQIIMVTHSEELIEDADAVFAVQIRKGVSKVTKIER